MQSVLVAIIILGCVVYVLYLVFGRERRRRTNADRNPQLRKNRDYCTSCLASCSGCGELNKTLRRPAGGNDPMQETDNPESCGSQGCPARNV